MKTVAKTEAANKANGTGRTSSAERLVVIRGDEVEETILTFLWKPYLPAGKLSHLAGDSSQAKSPITIDLAARTTSGADWPDRTENPYGARDVILLNIEDDYQDTILPRFRVAGGDKRRLHYVRGTKVPSQSGMVERGVALDTDIRHLRQLALRLPELGLMIFDPITNYLGKTRMHIDNDVRRILTPLSDLAAELRVVVLTVGHLNRREKGTDPMQRVLGAGAFVAVARAVYICGPDPDNASKYAHVMAAIRGCGGEGVSLRYKTEQIPDEAVGEVIRLRWCGESTATADLIADPESLSSRGRQGEAAELLREFLSDGRRSAGDCHQHMESKGYQLRSKSNNSGLNAARVRQLAGVKSDQFSGESFFSWYLGSKEEAAKQKVKPPHGRLI